MAINNTLNRINLYFEPDEDYQNQLVDGYSLDREKLAVYVGVVAFFLPVVILLSNMFGVTVARDTISHYHYTIFLGDAFIIAIAFMGTFLIAYKGESANETFWATVAGWSAYGIALFPVNGSGIEDETGYGRVFVNFKENVGTDGLYIFYTFGSDGATLDHHIWGGETFALFKWSDLLHSTSTGILFLFLAFYSLFIFTRVKKNQIANGVLTPQKLRRNRIYKLTGIVIFACTLAIFLASRFADDSIFRIVWRELNASLYLESIAMISFGSAWLVKGKFLGWDMFGLKWAD